MYESIHIQHCTSYKYDRLVTLGPQYIRLTPSSHYPLDLEYYSLNIDPEPSSKEWFNDIYENKIANILFSCPTSNFNIEVNLKAKLRPINIINFELPNCSKKYPFFYSHDERKKILPFLSAPEPTILFENFVNNILVFNKPTIELISEINKIVFNYLEYEKRNEPGIFSPEETLYLKKGSCRDFAWLLVNIFRKLGIASRFVSGYSIVYNEVDLHAWCEVYLPSRGWIGLDATSGVFCSEYYIPLAAAPFPSATAPVEGLISSCKSSFNVEMNLERVGV